MTVLLTIRPAAGCPPWVLDAVPGAYSEAGKQQFFAMPGCAWVRDPRSPNGRGYYRGPQEAITLVADLLQAAGVAKVEYEAPYALTFFPAPDNRLREYQQDGVVWLASMLHDTGAALLADEMGLGKTAQTIAALDLVAPVGPVAVICPAVVVPHWAAEARKWAQDPTRYFPVSYGKLKHLQLPAPAVGVVVDELHYCGNPKTQRTKAVRSLIEGPAVRPLVVGLSGTPMTARPVDLHEPLDILWPGRFGKWFPFTKRYCGGHYKEIPGGDPRMPKKVWDASGVSREEELGARMQAVMLRRTKQDAGVNLPPLLRQVIEVELPQRARDAIAKAASTVVDDKSIAAVLSRVESHKLKSAAELAEDIIAQGGRPLLLTLRRESADKLAEMLSTPAVAHGDTDPGKRHAVLTQDGASCGVSTVFAVETGINLTCFDAVIFCGLPWLPSTARQAEARAHRIGQQRTVNVYYLCALGTLDEVVRERVIERLGVAETVLGDDADGMAAVLSGNEDDLITGLVAAVRSRAA